MQLPQDIAQRYVLLLDPMLGVSIHVSMFHDRQLTHDKQLPVGRLRRLLR